MIQCGFCNFQDEDRRIVSKHWERCTKRLLLDEGMFTECMYTLEERRRLGLK